MDARAIEAAFKHALTTGRLAHALLFLGRAGSGREATAQKLAAGLVCDRKTAPYGCGTCASCARVAKGLHPDVHLVMPAVEAVRRGRLEPDGKKKPSEQIVAEDVRALAGALRMASYAGGARVAIVVDAHRMNPNAQNALLKTLEEPGANTTLVLLAPDERALLPTIASRCLRVRFSPPPAPEPGEASPLFSALVHGEGMDAALDAAEAVGRERAGADAALALLEGELATAARSSAAGRAAALDWREASATLDQLEELRRAFVQNANPQLGLEKLLLSRAARPS